MQFHILDVFAERRYAGNPLAVFVVDREIATDEMQQIAREIHFSESTFLTPLRRENGGFDVRIFTPDMEVPFAGHPSLGTAFAIRNLLGLETSSRVLLNLGVGEIPVTFDGETLTMEQKPPRFEAVIDDRERIARILSIDVADLDARFPVQCVSTGLPSVIVPLKHREAVGRCAIRHDVYQQFLDDTVKAAILVFARDAEDPANDLRVRVFVDDHGFFEDPATGSANGNLAGWLLEHRYFDADALRYRVEQGYEMGRPSLLQVEASKVDGQYTIRVGGRVFAVAQGQWP